MMCLRVRKHAMRVFHPTSLLLPLITLQLPLLWVLFYHSSPQIYLLIFLHIRDWSTTKIWAVSRTSYLMWRLRRPSRMWWQIVPAESNGRVVCNLRRQEYLRRWSIDHPLESHNHDHPPHLRGGLRSWNKQSLQSVSITTCSTLLLPTNSQQSSALLPALCTGIYPQCS